MTLEEELPLIQLITNKRQKGRLQSGLGKGIILPTPKENGGCFSNTRSGNTSEELEALKVRIAEQETQISKLTQIEENVRKEMEAREEIVRIEMEARVRKEMEAREEKVRKEMEARLEQERVHMKEMFVSWMNTQQSACSASSQATAPP
jgi:hypothetical protein